MFTYRALYKAYLRCRAHKRNTLNALAFEENLIENLCYLERSLNSSGALLMIATLIVKAKGYMVR
jgi:hypothetical protein